MAKVNTYHKEDLRGDLVKAGLTFVEENGHVSLSVRTLAQEVGVSPGAPYHHFPDRRSLLLAIAIEGFKELIGGVVAITHSGLKGAEQLVEMGHLFVAFTGAHPRLAELMYESELTNPQHDPAVEEFQIVGQGILRDAIRSELPKATPKEVEIRAVAFWSAIYGFAALRRKHNVPNRAFESFHMDPDDVARSVITQAAKIAVSKR